MPIIRKAAAICDRCGAKREFDAKAVTTIPSQVVPDTSELKGWRGVAGEKCLCPDCAGLHDEMKERHAREEREFMGVDTVEFEI